MDSRPRPIRFVIMAVLLATVAMRADAATNSAVATVYAVGRSSIQGADMSASQRAAVDDSLAAAVTAALTDLIPPQTAVGNFQVISEAILSKADRYIIDYKVLTESIHAKDHRVMVKVNVSLKRLTRALNSAGIPISQKQYPRILFCIAERWAGDLNYRYWWSGQPAIPNPPAAAPLSDIFKRQGYPAAAVRGSERVPEKKNRLLAR